LAAAWRSVRVHHTEHANVTMCWTYSVSLLWLLRTISVTHAVPDSSPVAIAGFENDNHLLSTLLQFPSYFLHTSQKL